MKVADKLSLLAGSIFLIGQPLPAASKSAVPQALPQVTGPIAVTADSRPLVAPLAPLTEASYVEEEYFLSGMANTYDWAGPRGHQVKVIAGPGKYVTRILVRRPRDPARFGGNVEVTVYNSGTSGDFGAPTDFARTVSQGDVWIGISTKPVAAKGMQRFDPVRYAPLDWSNPAPADKRCAQPSLVPIYMIGKEAFEALSRAGLQNSWPETEDGLVWDMLGQLGLLLKSEQRSQILPGFRKPWVYMTGISLSGIYIRTWIAAFHDRYRTHDGKPVYDGYLPIVGPAMARINQCAADVPLDDPRQKLAPPDVPFISLSSEGEMWQARYTHQPDAFTRTGGIVTYEVTGGSHRAGDVPRPLPYDMSPAGIRDMMKASGPPPKPVTGAAAAAGARPVLPPGTINNDLIWEPLVRGANHNLQLWGHQGIRPPQSPGIAIGPDHEIIRDEYGNARGGLRMPYIDVPLAAHTGSLGAGGMAGVMGAKKLFSPETLRRLYPDSAGYVVKFSTATDRLVAGRWISAEDGEAMKQAAIASAPKP